ncbi:MAG: mycofactocin-associated electron transfer flavoprotein beta subunit [Actinomycetota bacterium]
MPTQSSEVVVCVKWAPPRLSNDPTADERFGEMSQADQAALEFGLRTAEAMGSEVVVVTVGPQSADKVLRDALACGAHRAIRIDAPADVSTRDAASAAARTLSSLGSISLIWCGDYSTDRGSGAFPAFLAAHLGLEQSLGLIRVDFGDDTALPLDVVRRLDGGRRERSRVISTAVLSVEGSVVRLRRASLGRTLSAQSQPIEIAPSALSAAESPIERPYRPRARVIPAPMGSSPLDRVRSVTESASPKISADPVQLDPRRAAELILERLREWGYTE